MNVLGLHGYSHDAGAALVGDRGVFAISLERLTRLKYDGRFPAEAINYVLALAGLKNFKQLDMAVCDALAFNAGNVERDLRAMGYRGPFHVAGHHDCHAATAYYTSPFKNAAVLVIDACGSFARELPAPPDPLPHVDSRELQSYYAARNGRLELISTTLSAPGRSVGPGTMYGLGAMMAGFSDIEGGKLMALAAFGKRDDLFPDCAFTEINGCYAAPGDPNRDPLLPGNLTLYSKRFFRGAPPRKPDEPLKQIHSEIARAVQNSATAAALGMATHLHAATGIDNLCVAGGFGLNCTTNPMYTRKTPFKRLYVHPAATDAGIPLGAALYGYHVIARIPFRPRVFSPFLGKRYSESEILEALTAADGIEYRRPRSAAKTAAELLAEGKIGGWLRGRGEHGPRALGARSIIADPRHMKIKVRLNTTIKLREEFRPYAPAVLKEYCSDFFDPGAESPYMLLLADTKPQNRKLIPAVLHVDGTARPQTVSKNSNPAFYKLINEFYRITGMPMILNTSFNRRGEPIVESPRDAIACLLETDLDFLALEDYIVVKKQQRKPGRKS